MNGDDEDYLSALNNIAGALRMLGTADASTHLGAIEFHAMCVEKGSDKISEAISEVAAEIGRTCDESMSVRDQLALGVVGHVLNWMQIKEIGRDTASAIAVAAYEIADAMLRQ